jgi:hypothetical protein
MSLTSYRAAPPRANRVGERSVSALTRALELGDVCEWVLVCSVFGAGGAAMPGGDLLFHRLGDSTIGAVGFHVRVRDGIGWDTDAMATRQWSLAGTWHGDWFNRCTVLLWLWLSPAQRWCWGCGALKRE